MADSDFWMGALGGLMLAAIAVVNTLPALAAAERPLWGQTMLASLPVGLLYGTMGGTVTWVFQGRSGMFLTGLTAVGFLATVLGGDG